VIDGLRTGRWSVAELEKTEKTYIGTKVEILFRFDLELERGQKLDVRINGEEVDIKCTVRTSWMIPREAFGEICLLVRIDDKRSKFWIGLVRTNEVLLNSENQDRKKSLTFNRALENGIWIVSSGTMPRSILHDLAPEDRVAILSGRSGRARLEELFRRVQGKVISSVALETVGRQKDTMRRFRQVRSILSNEGIEVLHWQWLDQRRRAASLSFVLKRDECVALKTDACK